jgi:hypothetical protein
MIEATTICIHMKNRIDQEKSETFHVFFYSQSILPAVT